MNPLLVRAGVRYHLRHRWQVGLAILGVALGAGVVVAVDVATASARRAFELTSAAVGGLATHEIAGGPAGIPDDAYVRIRHARPHGVHVAPVIDRYVRSVQPSDRVLRLLGVDPFADMPFRRIASPDGSPAVDLDVLLSRRAIVLERQTAASMGVRTGDTIRVRFGVASSHLEVAGLLDPRDDPGGRALADVALADISTAQEVTGSLGRIDRIELRVDADAAAGALDSVAAVLPPGLRLEEASARVAATTNLARAFDTNLTALALVALMFGLFLIYNSVSFSVVQRRPLLGLLRAQGVTARELFALILIETALLGIVATMLGIAGGMALGSRLVQLVARTINDLYFAVNVTAVQLDTTTFVKAAALGIGGTIAAAIPPALEAVRVRPRAAMTRAVLERGAVRRAPRLLIAAFAWAAIALLLLLTPSQSVWLGFAALFVFVLAAALATPAATILVMRAVRFAAARAGPIARMAARGVVASLSRTAPAIAALGVALAVGIAITVMIGSFRAGVVRWLDRTLQADIYIAAPDLGANPSAVSLDPGLAAAILRLPQVDGVSIYRRSTVLVGPDRPDRPGRTNRPDRVRTNRPDLVRVFGFGPYEQHRGAFELLDAPAGLAWRRFDAGAVFVSESLGYRRGIGAGDTITLPSERGPVRLPVAAVYRDYASESGVIFMALSTYDALWDDRSVSQLAVFVADEADAAAVLDRIRALPEAGGSVLRLDRGLRAATLEVFDRTFLITGVLRLLALLVAFVGVTGALIALQLERSREIGVLRATGLTPVQVWALVMSQTGLMGVAAAALAAPLGVILSWAMVEVINRRAFGWTFDLLLTGTPFAEALGVGIAAALVAGVVPSLRMARVRPAVVLRSE